MVNGAVQSFMRAAAIEIAPQRINAVSPTAFTESMAEATGPPSSRRRTAVGPRGGAGLPPDLRGRSDGHTERRSRP